MAKLKLVHNAIFFLLLYRTLILLIKYLKQIMDISEITSETIYFFNSDALDYMAEYYQINRLPPNVQHNRINRNQIFRDHFVECDVFDSNRILEIKS